MTIQLLYIKPTSRGVRVWLEDTANNARLSSAGFIKGSRYDRVIQDGVITLTPNPDGKYKVSGKAYPIIDISAKKLDGFESGDSLQAIYSDSLVTITGVI